MFQRVELKLNLIKLVKWCFWAFSQLDSIEFKQYVNRNNWFSEVAIQINWFWFREMKFSIDCNLFLKHPVF